MVAIFDYLFIWRGKEKRARAAADPDHHAGVEEGLAQLTTLARFRVKVHSQGAGVAMAGSTRAVEVVGGLVGVCVDAISKAGADAKSREIDCK